MYLEWAPEKIISGNLHKKVDKEPVLAIGGDQVKRAALEQQLIASTNGDTDLDSTEVHCFIFIMEKDNSLLCLSFFGFV